MKVNLNYLKFHSFFYNKKLHNQYVGKEEEIHNYFEHIFFKNDHSLSKLINIITNIDSFDRLKKASLRIHDFSYDKKQDICKVIRYKHPKLYDELNQVLECDNGGIFKIKYFQTKLDKKERLIFFVYRNTVYPIIFDINHHFYKKEDKNYDNNIINSFEWNFKDRQNELKSKLLMIDELK